MSKTAVKNIGYARRRRDCLVGKYPASTGLIKLAASVRRLESKQDHHN
jgi:hypothetical protein